MSYHLQNLTWKQEGRLLTSYDSQLVYSLLENAVNVYKKTLLKSL